MQDRNINERALGRAILKKEKCLYCDYCTEDIEKLKKHEEGIHGCYRDINPRTRKVSNAKDTLIRPTVLTGDSIQRWNKNTCQYDEVTSSIKDVPKEDDYKTPDGKYHCQCKNCGSWYTFTSTPWAIGSLINGKWVIRPMKENEYPYNECSSCHWNIHKEVDIALMRKKMSKFPKHMRPLLNKVATVKDVIIDFDNVEMM